MLNEDGDLPSCGVTGLANVTSWHEDLQMLLLDNSDREPRFSTAGLQYDR